MYLRQARGFGVIEALVGIAVISVVVGLSMQLLTNSFANQASIRRAMLVKKSFSGAEMVLIDQRQCRCNFGSPRGPMSFKWNLGRSPNQILNIPQIRTFADVETCNGSAEDDILADTTGSLTDKADYIEMTNFISVIPELLYRATVEIKPHGGASVQFPILIETRPDKNSSYVDVEICGVDRAS